MAEAWQGGSLSAENNHRLFHTWRHQLLHLYITLRIPPGEQDMQGGAGCMNQEVNPPREMHGSCVLHVNVPSCLEFILFFYPSTDNPRRLFQHHGQRPHPATRMRSKNRNYSKCCGFVPARGHGPGVITDGVVTGRRGDIIVSASHSHRSCVFFPRVLQTSCVSEPEPRRSMWSIWGGYRHETR